MSGRWWKVIAIVTLWLAGFAWGVYAGHAFTDAAWSKDWALRDKADTEALAQREAAERTEEQRRQQAITRITQNAQQQIAAVRADADSAADADDRLQQTIKQLQRRLRDSKTSGNTGTAATGQAAASQCGVLTDMFSESVERNQHLAAEADRRRIAGLACERAYDSLIQTQ